MARRIRASAPVTIIHVHQDGKDGDAPPVVVKARKKSKRYESVPKYGKQDEPVGKGTSGRYVKSKAMVTGDAATEVE